MFLHPSAYVANLEIAACSEVRLSGDRKSMTKVKRNGKVYIKFQALYPLSDPCYPSCNSSQTVFPKHQDVHHTKTQHLSSTKMPGIIKKMAAKISNNPNSASNDSINPTSGT
jgi:hypothetical protein